VLSLNSNVHVAAHKDWFIDLTLVDSHIHGLSPGINIEGVGTVELEIPTIGQTAALHYKVTLKDVLYIPHFLCNLIGCPLLDEGSDYDIDLAASSLITKETRKQGGIFEEKSQEFL
jgi:hypothetical protein